MTLAYWSRRGLHVACGSLALLGVGCGGTGPAAPPTTGTEDDGAEGRVPTTEERSPLGGQAPVDGLAPNTEQTSSTPGERIDVAGGQTTDFGDAVTVRCPVRDTETVSIETARARGFDIDAHLGLLLGRFETTWQRRPSSCADTRSQTGALGFDVQLAEVYIESYANTPDLMCADEVKYVVRVDVTSSDGLVSGSFQARASLDGDGLLGGGQPDARDFSGSLGILVDRARPRASMLSISLAFTSRGVAGSLYTLVGYDDALEPRLDRGEVVFWPPQSGEWQCNEREEEPEGGAELISLDAYRSND